MALVIGNVGDVPNIFGSLRMFLFVSVCIRSESEKQVEPVIII